MDFLDSLKVVDDAVDLHLSETAELTLAGVVYPDLRGPFERDEFTDETGSARSSTLKSTFSVQSDAVPADCRGGTLVCRGETFIVADYDDPIDGRTVLILDKHAAT